MHKIGLQHRVHTLYRASFSIMMECTPESGHCHSVCTLSFKEQLYLFFVLPTLMKISGVVWASLGHQKEKSWYTI
jgi:hypothetical protein